MDTIGNMHSEDSIAQSITDWARNQITEGNWRKGMRLPSMHSMAKEWDTSYFTLYSALTPLVREGLLERRRKYGTRVLRDSPVISCVAIYFGMDVWARGTTSFYQVLYISLKQVLQEQGLDFKLIVDFRGPRLQQEILPELGELVRNREVQALIVSVASAEEKVWLRNLPIPQVYVGSGKDSERVGFDAIQGVEMALKKLIERGSSKIGFIGGHPAKPTHITVPPGEIHSYTRFYQQLNNLFEKFGIEVNKQWYKIPENELKVDEIEPFGYISFREIWELPELERPHGLLCVNDIIGRGVVMGILEEQAHLDKQLNIVLKRNSEVDFFCPFPVDWIEFHVIDLARALVARICRQAQENRDLPINVPVYLKSYG